MSVPPDPFPPCPHCPDGHQDPNRRPWAAWMSPKLVDSQPTGIVVARSDGAHVAESDGQWARDLLNGRACRQHADPPLPARGDHVEAWLKQQRDAHGWHGTNDRARYDVLDHLLDDYRLHADTGTPLDQHCCEGGNVDDCAGCYDTAVRDA